jgi:hypothetical protein
MRAHVYLSELLDAFHWVSAGDASENAAYVSRESGRIYWTSGFGDLEEEVPEDIRDETLYARVPDRHDLDLGQRLVFRFVTESAPHAYDQVRGYFSRKGAYSRYKDFLDRSGLLERWYAYEEQALAAALREWAESEDLNVVEGKRAEG